MKNQEKAVKEVKEVKKQNEKKPVPQEQKMLTEMMRTLRKNAYHYVKKVMNLNDKEEAVKKLDDSFKEFNNKLASLQAELDLQARFSAMTDAEKEWLKKMLNEEKGE